MQVVVIALPEASRGHRYTTVRQAHIREALIVQHLQGAVQIYTVHIYMKAPMIAHLESLGQFLGQLCWSLPPAHGDQHLSSHADTKHTRVYEHSD